MSRLLGPSTSFALSAFFSLGLCGIASADDFPSIINTQRAGEEPPPPAEAAAAITVPPGFKVTLFAGEPDVAQPIATDFDDRGRLLVAECYTYTGREFDGDHLDRVLILNDKDNDGRFDERKVFWDKGWMLSSIAWGFDGLWVLHDGTLSHIADANHDDVPDAEPVVHLDGFTLEAEHNVVNGLIWGPDGWLYGRHGILATSLPEVPGTPESERTPLNCGIWRYHPTRHLFEVVCRGTTNPWGLDYDENGNFFFTNNVIGHAWHVIPGAHYKRMYGEDFNPHLYELIDQHADHYHWDITGNWQDSREGAHGADALGGGHSHCGGMIYLGDNWPKEYRGGFFMCNTHGRRVNHDIPVREGSGFVLKHGKDVIFANQPWFRGVSLIYGPDGGVYVSDWSDLGECHDHDGVHRTSGRIYKVTYAMPKALRKDLDLAKLSDKELAELIKTHSNHWFVRRARRLLQERAAAGDDVAKAVASIASEKELDRLWTAHATGTLQKETLFAALNGDDENVRALSIRLLTDTLPVPADVAEQLAEGVGSDNSPLVRLSYASAMQRLDGEPRWQIAEALAKHAEDASDHNLPLMIWYGLEPLVPYNVDRSLAIAKTTPIPVLRQFIARRVASLGTEKPQSLAKLMDLLAEEKDASKRADVLTGIAAALRGARRVDPPQGWDALRDELVGSQDAAVATPAKELAVVFGDGRTMDSLKQVAADANADPNARRDALQVLIRSGEQDLAQLLKKLVTDRSVGAVAVKGLGSVGAADTPDVLLKNFWKLPKDARPDAVAALTVREPWALALLDEVEKGEVPKELVTASDARQMSSLGSKKVDERLSEVWGTIRTTPAAVREDIERLRGQLTPDVLAHADLANGRGLYTRMCANCHKLYGEGTAVGPDLTGGNRASLDYLLENLLDPSATVPEAYRSSVIVLKDGRVLTGVIAGKSENRLTLQTATDKQTLDAADVEEVKPTELSLMPNGQLDRLSDEEVRDLIAYLQSKLQVPLAGE